MHEFFCQARLQCDLMYNEQCSTKGLTISKKKKSREKKRENEQSARSPVLGTIDCD